MEHNYTDDQIISMVRAGGAERYAALKFFFKDAELRQSIIRTIERKGGSAQDAEDAFHDGFKVFNRQLMAGQFRGESKLRTWLSNICVRCWLDGRKKSYAKQVDLTDQDYRLDGKNENTPESRLLNKEYREKLRAILGLLGEKCQGVFLMKYENYDEEEISTRFNLGGADKVRKVRNRCKKKLKDKLQQFPHLLRLLNDLRYA